ncbi:hypothetical protein KI659_16350 [Litoribacter alkaliphilus]|uniref:Uncharacterized protein n=1 Tax=Litoribacter ruber TaxID=702568 RepID=A0AAP2G5J1_9BACT|nr:hypothetical protein [Litoribacter alkaliphilus]MBS9525590.1 hypothetical protein [Litoribacter alkaliphilus]
MLKEVVSIEIKAYSHTLEPDWQEVLENSVNGAFFHSRKFIQYHGGRFEDASAILYYKNSPFAIFPANQREKRIYSHQGLSFGGLILKNKTTFAQLEAALDALLEHYYSLSVQSIEFRLGPQIYSQENLESLEYLLTSKGAEQIFSDLTYAIPMPAQQRGRTKRWKIRKSHLQQFEVFESVEYQFFWENLLKPNLQERYGVKPTHTFEEVLKLKKLFPNEIKLFLASQGNEVLGGVCVFETEGVAHLQYIAASQIGKKLRALDYLIDELVHQVYKDKRWFDFGRNVDSNTNQLNRGLVQWKESFGAQPFLQKTLQISLI